MIALRITGATRDSGTFTRFWSYRVASTAPSRPRIRVRCASGSAARAAGRLFMLSAALRVDSPVTAAKGRASPATRTPMTPATATITPRWDSTLAGRRRSVRDEDMPPRLRDRKGAAVIPHSRPPVTHSDEVRRGGKIPHYGPLGLLRP